MTEGFPQPALSLNEITIPEILKPLGYKRASSANGICLAANT